MYRYVRFYDRHSCTAFVIDKRQKLTSLHICTICNICKVDCTYITQLKLQNKKEGDITLQHITIMSM